MEIAGRTWGSFYHQGLHSSGREGGGSRVYEMKPAGLTAENHVHFHKKDSAYLGQFAHCIFRDWRMKTGQLLFLGITTCELRGLFPWCWQHDCHTRLGQTWGHGLWPAVLLPPPLQQTPPWTPGALVLGEPQLDRTRHGHFFCVAVTS